MAKQKPTSRAAARTAAQKKSPRKSIASKTAAKSSARKTIKAKDRKTKARAQPSAKRARPKQRIAISHYRDEDFLTNGLRTYAQYRDLGIADATHGLAQAHVIRLIGPCNPRSEEHTSELQSLAYIVCRLLLEKKKRIIILPFCQLLIHSKLITRHNHY